MRKTPLRKRGPKYKQHHARTVAQRRARKATTHERAYGSDERKAWLRAWTCMAWRSQAPWDCGGSRIELAHTETGGVGRKADAATLIPLCQVHHRELHQHGAKSFEAIHGFTLKDAAARCEREWQRHCAAQ